MSLGNPEQGVMRVGLVSFVREDGVAQCRVEKGDNWQQYRHTEAHDRGGERGGRQTQSITFYTGQTAMEAVPSDF